MLTNDQLRALMTTIIYCGINISNDWAMGDLEKPEDPIISLAVGITEEICSKYTTLIV